MGKVANLRNCDSVAIYMKNFKKGGFRSGGFKGADRGDRGDRDSRPMTMHSAVCSSCGKSCEVPFRPTGDKPVYCRDCFAGRAAMGGERSSRKDFRVENKYENRPEARMSAQGSIGNEEIKKQLESINSKLEKLIAIVQSYKPLDL